MYRPLALYIGLRYTRAKRRTHFVSFISLASVLGIALGVMVLITVLSVMNGFDHQIRQRFFAMVPQVTVISPNDITQEWQSLSSTVDRVPAVTDAAPFISGKAMLIHEGQVNAVEVLGILPKQEQKISKLPQLMVDGRLASLQANTFHIVLGQKLAQSLGLTVGGKVNLFTPQTTMTPVGLFPRFRQFTVSGIFATKSGFGFDSGVAYISLPDARRLFPLRHSSNGLHIKLNDIYAANSVTETLQGNLPIGYFVSNWTQRYGAFFSTLGMEKTMMFVILLFIIAVAAFNLVSSLVMVVNDKRADIAILRTLGATRSTIMSTFIIQGAALGLVGTLLGVVSGILLALNVTAVVNALQNWLHVQFISASVYFGINFLPSKLQLSDIVLVASLSFALCLLATLYPAFMAFRTHPAEALRYE